MICCKKEMKILRGAVRECSVCGSVKFDYVLDKENRKELKELAKEIKYAN